LHFVGGVRFDPVKGEGVATNRIHYSDGQTIDVPVIAGRDLAKWWFRPGESTDGLDVVWTGSTPKAADDGNKIRLLHFAWSNPRPEVVIESLDFISAVGKAAPFLVAITAE
jgi:hypothetical protein